MTRRRNPPKTCWLPLSTPRLLLRPFQEDDLADAHAYASDPEVTRFMIWGPNTREESRAFLDRKLAEQSVWPRADVSMAVELVAERRLIGAFNLEIVDPVHRTAEFGYCLASVHWGRGYATEATGALIRHGFEVLGLHRIIGTCDTRNARSWRVMERLGLRREGQFKRDRKARRGWRDSYLYAVLASEWRARNPLGNSV